MFVHVYIKLNIVFMFFGHQRVKQTGTEFIYQFYADMLLTIV